MHGLVYELVLIEEQGTLNLRLVPRTIAMSFSDAIDRKALLSNHDGNEYSVYTVELVEEETDNQ